MRNKIIEEFNSKQIEEIKSIKDRSIESFAIGDTVEVKYKITEGANVRIQAFKGIVISKTKDINNFSSTFTVRKNSSGIYVERKFVTFSPLLVSVALIKKGVVRRAKLYYLRSLTGKASRIKEKLDF